MSAATPSTPRRSPRNTKIVKSETEVNQTNGVEAGMNNEESDSDNENVLEIQMKAFMRNVKKLQENLKEMRKQNQSLQRRLDVYKDGMPTTPRKKATGNIENRLKMQGLEERIDELEERNAALNKKIKKLRREQLKAEADELNNDAAVDGVGDPDGFNNMRKLLRRFSDMMSITTLGEDEDCVICLERLKSAKTYGMPCDHLVCVECLPNISKGTDETVKCPLCRRVHGREDLELLRYTETERWDELLVIAEASSVIDYGAGTTTSEEEEGSFIDDGPGEESRAEASDRDEAEAQGGDEEAGGRTGEEDQVKKEEPVPPGLTPEPPATYSYATSPTSEKRKRLEDLAQSRSEKKRRVL